MTATLPRPTPSAPAESRPAAEVERSGTRRTLLALLASALGATPLRAILTDSGWLIDVWLTMIVVIGPAALLRRRRPPNALDIWPGIVLMIPWLTLLFVKQHAWLGIIPSGHTWRDVGQLMDNLHRTTNNSVAPIHSTLAVRLVLCALLGLLAALVDLIAVVGRRGALAGVPLLVIYTVSGAVPRSPVAWGWFLLAAAGYLILLQLDAGDELRHWGRRISRPDRDAVRPRLSFSAGRIGVIAIIVAVVLPFLVPANSKNLIASAFHDHAAGVGGFGAGTGTSGISPFAALKGQLDRNSVTDLMTVHVSAARTVQPFYARANVLDRFTGSGWVAGDHGSTVPLAQQFFGGDTVDNGSNIGYTAEVSITGLSGNAPVFTRPDRIDGLEDNPSASYSSQDGLLLGAQVQKGDQYAEQVEQPDPTPAELETAPAVDGSQQQFARYLQLPGIPAYVHNLVASIIKGKSTPYDRARAISNYFANPSNGFVYSLKTASGDSGNELVDFLKNKIGFCQQYAAAMGVMLRLAGVPARVVLGYMHQPPDTNGDFTITTSDAHAWVEAYFPGFGWIPFDPTPTTGLDGGKKTDLAWAPHSYGTSNTTVPNFPGSTATNAPDPKHRDPLPNTPVAAAPPAASHAALIWSLVAVLAVLLLALTPAAVRATRRRRRYAAARRGDADALWAELSDTATDLGYVWSPSRSPRQVSAWLGRDAGSSAASLDQVAAAVERAHFAPADEAGTGATGTTGPDLSRELRQVSGSLTAGRSGGVRLRAALWPPSLGWGRWARRAVRAVTSLGRRH
jgi:transglutaminase-like putative cysteine protease